MIKYNTKIKNECLEVRNCIRIVFDQKLIDQFLKQLIDSLIAKLHSPNK